MSPSQINVKKEDIDSLHRQISVTLFSFCKDAILQELRILGFAADMPPL